MTKFLKIKTDMKRIFTLFTLCLLAVAALSAEQPTVVFDTTSHDFGNINEADGPVSCEFTFTNTGDEPLVIISANASCGCTRPEFPKKPIKPGKSGTIKVTYLPAGRPGEFNKTVKVRTSAKRPKSISLKISGVVIPKSAE